jgi:hypothetical protein
MSFGIYISTIVLIYVIGVFIAQRVHDNTADPDLAESQREVARARASILWPARITRRVISVLSRHTSVPANPGQPVMDIHPDLQI